MDRHHKIRLLVSGLSGAARQSKINWLLCFSDATLNRQLGGRLKWNKHGKLRRQSLMRSFR